MGELKTPAAAGLAISAVGYRLLTWVDGARGLAVAVAGIAIIRFGSGPLTARCIEGEK